MQIAVKSNLFTQKKSNQCQMVWNGSISHDYLIATIFILRLQQLSNLIRNKLTKITILFLSIKLSHRFQKLDSYWNRLILCTSHMFIVNLLVLETNFKNVTQKSIGKLKIEKLLDLWDWSRTVLHKFQTNIKNYSVLGNVLRMRFIR